jgi:hypothetical protein
MFATVLPGVRYIRTPLTVGYMWFLVLWLAIGHQLPTPSRASGMLADIFRIAHAVGPAGTAVAVSVAAYVVGILLVPLSFKLIDVSGTAFRRTAAAVLTPGHRRYVSTQSALRNVVVERLSARFCSDEAFRSEVLDAAEAMPSNGPSNGEVLPRDRSSLEKLTLSNGYARYQTVAQTADLTPLVDDLMDDLPYIAQRLQGENIDINEEYNRLKAESDFRLAIFFPIASLFGVLAIRWQPLWWIGTAASFALLYLGVASRVEAERMLGTALAAGRIDDPALQRVDMAAVRFLWPAEDIDHSMPAPTQFSHPGSVDVSGGQEDATL